jgi:uncharacterized protein with FMN-binding domain
MKKRYIVIAAVILFFIIAASAVKIIFSKAESAQQELIDTEINDVDLASARDGTYTGRYSAFPVSAEVSVTVKNHLITDIEIIKHFNGEGQGAEVIPERVIDLQSLKVDCVSGATISSKVILMAIYDALSQALPGTEK